MENTVCSNSSWRKIINKLKYNKHGQTKCGWTKRNREAKRSECWHVIVHTTSGYLKTIRKTFSIKLRHIENINIYKGTLKFLEWTNLKKITPAVAHKIYWLKFHYSWALITMEKHKGMQIMSKAGYWNTAAAHFLNTWQKIKRNKKTDEKLNCSVNIWVSD